MTVIEPVEVEEIDIPKHDLPTITNTLPIEDVQLLSLSNYGSSAVHRFSLLKNISLKCDRARVHQLDICQLITVAGFDAAAKPDPLTVLLRGVERQLAHQAEMGQLNQASLDVFATLIVNVTLLTTTGQLISDSFSETEGEENKFHWFDIVETVLPAVVAALKGHRVRVIGLKDMNFEDFEPSEGKLGYVSTKTEAIVDLWRELWRLAKEHPKADSYSASALDTLYITNCKGLQAILMPLDTLHLGHLVIQGTLSHRNLQDVFIAPPTKSCLQRLSQYSDALRSSGEWLTFKVGCRCHCQAQQLRARKTVEIYLRLNEEIWKEISLKDNITNIVKRVIDTCLPRFLNNSQSGESLSQKRYFSAYRVILAGDRAGANEEGNAAKTASTSVDPDATSVPSNPTSTESEAVADQVQSFKEEFSMLNVSSCETEECVEACERLREILRKEFLDLDRPQSEPNVDANLEGGPTEGSGDEPITSDEVEPVPSIVIQDESLKCVLEPAQ